MIIESLSFGPDAQTPEAHATGIVIVASPGAGAHLVVVHGACKIALADAPLQGVDIPHGIFVTAIDALDQRPFTRSLVGQRLVFPEDVSVLNDHYLVEFRAVLDVRLSMVGPYYLHASFFEHVSNVVYVVYQAENSK